MLRQRFLRIILLILFSVSLLLSINIMIWRTKADKEIRCIELALDYTSVSLASEKYGLNLDEVLREFQSAGVTSLAVEPETLERLSQQGQVSLLSREELNKKYYLTGNSRLRNFLEGCSSWWDVTFIVFEEEDIFRSVTETLSSKLPHKQKTYSFEDNLIYAVEAPLHLMKNAPVDFNCEELAYLNDKGFYLIPRVENWWLSSDGSKAVRESLEVLDKVPGISAVIFVGTEVLGYPDQFEHSAGLLNDKGISFGLIEFYPQEGAEQLAALTDYNVVKVHGIREDELQECTVDEAAARWERAAKERSHNLFYLRPFEAGSGEAFIDINKEYIEKIVGNLTRLGFTFGPAASIPHLQIEFMVMLLLLLGIGAAMLWFLQKAAGSFSLPANILILFLYAILSVLGLYLSPLLWKQLTAFTAAVFFPLFGIYLYKDWGSASPDKVKILPVIKKFTIISLASTAGGLITAAVLTDPPFISKLYLFRGVKAAYLLPLLILGILLFSGRNKSSPYLTLRDIGLTIKKWLLTVINFKSCALGFIMLGLALIYLIRTGSEAQGMVMQLEHRFREFLEYYLIARPRNKEFLFGHPLLLLGLSRHVSSGEKNIFLLLGAIGQISLVNTFCHPGNPLHIILFRVFNGMLFGIITGIILIYIYNYLNRRVGEFLNND